MLARLGGEVGVGVVVAVDVVPARDHVQVGVLRVDPGVDDRDHPAGPGAQGPGQLGVDVHARGPAPLTGVLQVPLVGHEGIVGEGGGDQGDAQVGVGPPDVRAGAELSREDDLVHTIPGTDPHHVSITRPDLQLGHVPERPQRRGVVGPGQQPPGPPHGQPAHGRVLLDHGDLGPPPRVEPRRLDGGHRHHQEKQRHAGHPTPIARGTQASLRAGGRSMLCRCGFSPGC